MSTHAVRKFHVAPMILALAILVATLAASGSSGATDAAEPRRVWAHWYPWIDENAPQRVGPDKPVFPFDVSDPKESAAAIDVARAHGINGFIFFWRGTHLDELDALFRAADARPGFTLAPNLIFPAAKVSGVWSGKKVRGWIDQALSRWGWHPSFAREPDGREIFFVWGGTDQSPRKYRDWVKRPGISLVGETLQPEYNGIFDGFYRYGIARFSPAEIASMYKTYRQKTRALGIDFYATVNPGFNNTWQRKDARFVGRQDGARYAKTWDVALAASPDHIAITSWNEWNEQTHVQEGTKTGRIALDQTGSYAAKFLGS